MTRSRCINFFARAAIVPLAALAAAGYGSGVTAAGASTAPQKATKGKAATVRVAKTDLGKILVNSKGRTLYLFRADQGTTSACSGECATAWPPLRANGTPKVGKGLNASLVATTPRTDGNPQVTYNGHPLYTFQGDKKAGDTNGQGLNAFGAQWFVLSPAGNDVTRQPSSSGGSNSGGGTSGY
jgi:predicted lipoprotein with Yx(FWY)xxD motif